MLTLTWVWFTLEVTALSITSSPDDCGRGSTRRLEIQHSIQTKIQCKNYKGAKKYELHDKRHPTIVTPHTTER